MGYFDGGFTVSDVFQSQLSETWATQQYFLPYFRNNVLLITGYPSTTTFISDGSANGFNLNVVGDIRATTENPYETNWSNFFAASDSRITVPASSLFAYGTGDFTVEGWFLVSDMTASTIRIIFSQSVSGTNYFVMGPQSSGSVLTGKIAFTGVGSGGGTEILSGSNLFTPGTWNHFAVCRVSGTVTVYLNGVGGTPTANATDFSNTALVPTIGGYTHATTQNFSGYISNLRIVKGTALYTGSTYTVPTAPLTAVAGTSLLTCQSNRFKDNSVNNLTFTNAGGATVNKLNPFTSNYLNYGSGYFDGSGDYLTVPNNTALNPGTGDFTLECWLYFNSFQVSNSASVLVDFRPQNTSGAYPLVYFNPAAPLYHVNGADVITGSALSLSTWYHFALCRSNSQTKMYINGVQTGSTYSDTTNYINNRIIIGASAYTLGAAGLIGYISDFRIIKGTAVYTGNFTPPSAPLLPMGTTTIYSSTANVNTTFSSANTSLLTLQTSRPHNNHTFFDNSPFNNLITRNGNPNQGTFSPYGTGWSNYFDGTGDYMTVPANAAFAMGTGDFTFEVWLYANVISTGTFDRICATSDYNGSGFDWTLNTSSSAFYLAGTSYNIGSIVPGVWHHLVYTRSGSDIRGFLNGKLSSYATGATQNVSSVTQLNIGTGYSGTALNGYLSGLRIIKGSIPTVYQTSSTTTGTQIFAPPTSPLTAISGTSILTCQSSGFKDNSVNDFAITRYGDISVQKFSPYEPSPPFSDSTQFLQSSLVGGSTYFDGTGDYLSIPNNSNFNQLYSTTVPFTIEFWVYMTVKSADANGIISTYNSNDGWRIDLHADGSVYWVSNGVNTAIIYAVPLNSWNHLAFVWNGTTIKMYLNGVNVSSGSTSWVNNSVPLLVGHMMTSGIYAFPYFGYLSDVRLVKGTQVYTGNFTPPIAPLLQSGTSTTYTSTANINTTFAAANTTLLLNFANATVKDYSGISTIEHTGNARLASNVSKFGGTALYFDGTTATQLKVSKLAANNPPTTVVGTANLTAEMWVYPLAMAAGTTYSLFTLGSETTGRYITSLVEGQIRTSYYGGSIIKLGGNVQPNVWSHIAIVRSGSSINGYVNGTLLTNTETNSSSIGNGGANIGADASGSTLFFGYIDDVRITNGNVRYTANFSLTNQLTIP